VTGHPSASRFSNLGVESLFVVLSNDESFRDELVVMMRLELHRGGMTYSPRDV
jgi:hypothetical protein